MKRHETRALSQDLRVGPLVIFKSLGTAGKNNEPNKKPGEVRRLKRETDRAHNVALMKQAHLEIEEIQKRRVRPAVKSVQERILALLDEIGRVFGELRKDMYLLDYSVTAELWAPIERDYDSIMIDFQEVMGLSEQRMQNLFPRVPALENSRQIPDFGTLMITQLKQMLLYSKRME
jgi:hypothetical protein